MAKKTSWRFCLPLFALIHTALALDCPSGWDGYGNSCYKVVVQSLSVRGLNWENARRDCLGYGGDLVSITNQSEMNFINGIPSKGSNEHYWIGLNDQRNERQFVWSDGTPYNTSVYSNWHPWAPRHGVGEDCVKLFDRHWNDYSCKEKNGYICKRPKGVPMPTFTTVTVTPPVTSATIACPSAWLFHGSSCYKFSTLTKNWINAKKDCRASGGYLLKIDNADEQYFITYHHRQSKYYWRSWIGLSYSTVEGSFMWESDNSLVNYTHWDAGEPNDYRAVEDCVELLVGASAGYWNDNPCEFPKHFICEKPVGVPMPTLTTVTPPVTSAVVPFYTRAVKHKNTQDKEKRQKPWMIAVISVVAGILSLVLIIVVCLRKRREKKLLAIAQKYDQEEQVFEKDLFVSYSSKDYDWVQESLLPVLDENNIKYIIHSRDFVPGKAWLDNMADSVYNSRKVILIMSMNYLSSAFCKDEMRMAIHRCSERDDSSLIVVRIDDINSSAMPKILRHRTFIDVTSREETATWQRRILEYVQSMVSSGSVTSDKSFNNTATKSLLSMFKLMRKKKRNNAEMELENQANA